MLFNTQLIYLHILPKIGNAELQVCQVQLLFLLGLKIVLWTDFIYLWQTAGGGAAAAMVASDMDEGAGEGWGEDAALVIDEGIYFF